MMAAALMNTMKLIFLFSALIFAVSFCNGQFNDAQKKEMQDKHNEGRRQQNAADMNELAWEEALETEGQRLVETCTGDFGSATVEGISNVGQLAHWSTGTSNPVNAFEAWYGEHESYDKETHTCRPGAKCGSFRTVVKNDLTKLGCGVKLCNNFKTSDGRNLQDVTYIVCLYDKHNYWIERRNFYSDSFEWRQQQHYINDNNNSIRSADEEWWIPFETFYPWPGPVFAVGKPCTRCPSGKSWCNNNLCQPSCTAASEKCQCHAKYAETCMNCGTANEADCSCKCADGFHGAYCMERCEDLPVGTNMHTSCTEDVIDDPEYFCTDLGASCCPYIRERTCKATCSPYTKLCTPLTSALEEAATTGCTQSKTEAPAGR